MLTWWYERLNDSIYSYSVCGKHYLRFLSCRIPWNTRHLISKCSAQSYCVVIFEACLLFFSNIALNNSQHQGVVFSTNFFKSRQAVDCTTCLNWFTRQIIRFVDVKPLDCFLIHNLQKICILFLFISSIYLLLISSIGILLDQGWANYGPKEHFVRPANTCRNFHIFNLIWHG